MPYEEGTDSPISCRLTMYPLRYRRYRDNQLHHMEFSNGQGDPPSSMLRPPTLLLPGGAEPPSGPRPHGLLMTPPVIREQGPSAPSSPTSPARGKRLCSDLNEEAMQRINLFQLGHNFAHDYGKLSPMTSQPGWQYATSDLGSSPRSSISVTSANLHPWNTFRDHHRSSFDLDDGSSDCGKDLLSPGMMLSPAPFSPFSDCDGTDTPYSSYARSPNLSPNPSSRSLNHFSFDPIRSSSSMSGRHAHLLAPSSSLDAECRERSRSDSDMSPKEERMDTSVHSTISVRRKRITNIPATTSRRLSSSGQYKKRLLQKYQEEQRHGKRSSSSPPPSATESELDDGDFRSVSRFAVPEESVEATPHATPPPADTLSALRASIPSSDMMRGWMEAQVEQHAALLQRQIASFGLLAPPPLIPKMVAKQTTIDEGCGPMKGATLWRRSRSETDVSRQQPISQNYPNGEHTCHVCGAGFTCHDRLSKHIASRHRDRNGSIQREDGAKVHKCTQCTKKFTRSDMLTRHMRLHTGAKPYECRQCGQVFSRSDHLSTHLRTHTGEKPYQCSKCNYTASRRDMITRHYRTHDTKDGGPELAIGQLSLSSSLSPCVSPLPSSLPLSSPLHPSPPFSFIPQTIEGVQAMLRTMGGSLDMPPTPMTSSCFSSGERSAFQPPASSSRLLAPPSLTHSLSVPSSPALSRQHTLSPSLSRQTSVGGYCSTELPCVAGYESANPP